MLSNTKCNYCQSFGHIKKNCNYYKLFTDPDNIPINEHTYSINNLQPLIEFFNDAIKFPITFTFNDNTIFQFQNYKITHINNIIASSIKLIDDDNLFNIYCLLNSTNSIEQIIYIITKFNNFKSITYYNKSITIDDIVVYLSNLSLINFEYKYETKRDDSPSIFINYINNNSWIPLLSNKSYINNWLLLLTNQQKHSILLLYSKYTNKPIDEIYLMLYPVPNTFIIQYE